MSDEIKENNTPNHILSALGDLTNGAINYYQLPKVALKEQIMILDYITDLQQKYEKADYDRHKLFEEKNRLNNIINELEKWAKSIQLTVYRSDDMPVYQHQDVLDKLKELKESNNE